VAQGLTIGALGSTAALNLSGGELSTATLSKSTGGTFSFNGGTLHADTVNFSLTNNGGALAPGHSIGQTHVVGDLTLASGSLQIELTSPTASDTLVVDGLMTLGGALNVATLGGFSPANGTSWQIAAAGGITGQFSSISAGYSVQTQGHNLLLFFGNPGIAGDYNGDGSVNGADYVVWRRALANGGTLLNETASIGTVDAADFDAWRANFGATSGAGAGTSFVPEPGSALLLLIASFAAFVPLQRRRNR
jgi:hypothetical protein